MAALSRVPSPASAASPSAPGIGKVFRDVSTYLAGPSAAMSRLHGQIRYVAPYFRTALLTGERDCGEEAAARALHRLSPLAHCPFLELTPAQAELRFNEHSHQGPSASEGMIYLPQPERLPPFSQKSLLRLLRERGPQAPRVVAFAENGIRSLVSLGTFSPELADTLVALRIALPPLRERSEDIPVLFNALLQEQSEQRGLQPPQLTADLLESTGRELWLGNFDQMFTVALALLKRSPEGPLHAEDLRAVLGEMPTPLRERRSTRMITLDRVIQEHIHAVLFSCNGNKLRAAEVLGISRSTLYRMLGSEGAAESAPRENGGSASQPTGYARLRVAS